MASSFKFALKSPGQQIQEYLYNTFMTLTYETNSTGFYYTRDEVYVEFRKCLDQYQIQFPIDDSYKIPDQSEIVKPFVFNDKTASSLERKLKAHFNILHSEWAINTSPTRFYELFMKYLNDHKYKFPIHFKDQQEQFIDCCQLYTSGQIDNNEFYQLSKSLFSDSE